jgi:hypothetical protein
MKATVIGLNPAISRNNRARRAQAAALSASADLRAERDRELTVVNAARERARTLSQQIRDAERVAINRIDRRDS